MDNGHLRLETGEPFNNIETCINNILILELMTISLSENFFESVGELA